eukprot:12492-Heterococcus_DN1.PRE.1
MSSCCLLLLLAVAAQAATVLVTGANRGLGSATASLLLKHGHAVVATTRGSFDALKHLGQLSKPATAERTWLWQLDVAQPDSVAQLSNELLPLVGPIDAVVNNAGACLVGNDVGTLRRTLDVNFYGAVNVWQACLPFLQPQGCVINVTSGDGELVCLSSSIAAELQAAETLQAVRAVAERAVTALTKDPALELACGPTPAYSLSKALLNAATRCSSSNNNSSSCGASQRVFAVCPGDVATRMCSAAAGDAVLSAEAAAEHIVAMALRPGDFTSGSFYRFRQTIPW